MCRDGPTFAHSLLTQIAVIDENLDCVYQTYVKPPKPITDYLTPFSGISRTTLEGVTTTLEDVQRYRHIRKVFKMLCREFIGAGSWFCGAHFPFFAIEYQVFIRKLLPKAGLPDPLAGPLDSLAGIEDSQDIVVSQSKEKYVMCRELIALLPRNAILVGHSFYSDLRAMKMFHPYVIDTALIPAFMRKGKKQKLKDLAQIHLGKLLQVWIINMQICVCTLNRSLFVECEISAVNTE